MGSSANNQCVETKSNINLIHTNNDFLVSKVSSKNFSNNKLFQNFKAVFKKLLYT